MIVSLGNILTGAPNKHRIVNLEWLTSVWVESVRS